jgi:hypothetical protein
MGKEWAWLAINHSVEPTTTGNLEHDQACAQEYARKKGKPPAWYTRERFGPIYPAYNLNRAWEPGDTFVI